MVENLRLPKLSGASVNGPAILRRAITTLVASTALGGLLAAGLALPVAAAETHSLTVSVTNVTGIALSRLEIIAIPVAGGHEIPGDRSADGSYLEARPVTGSAGTYVFDALGDFDHTLYFSTPTSTTFSQLLGGTSVVERAQVIPSGQSTLTVSLATNSVISGVVKTPSNKTLSKAVVSAYYYTGSEWLLYTSVKTDSKGKYSLTNLDPASYRLKFTGPKGEYSALYSGGGSTFDGASGVIAKVGTATTVNATFPKATGAITGSARNYYEGYEEYGTVAMSKALPVAYPVSNSGEYPYSRVLDVEHGVAGARSSASGAWTIKNLVPGDYVVKLFPYYYNQASIYVGGYGDSYSAKVFTVTAGKTLKATRTSTTQSEKGGSLTVHVQASYSTNIVGADVLLQDDADPDYYVRGTTGPNGTVELGRSGKTQFIQPGSFTLTVVATDTHRPFRGHVSIGSGSNSQYVNLATAQAGGFVAAPSIAESELGVGTLYTVAAQAKRYGDELSYQWLRDGKVIYGADSGSYTSRSGDIATQLSVRVTTSQFGFTSQSATASVLGVVTTTASAPESLTPPAITPSGSPWVGETLRVLPGRWSVPGLTYSYQWFRDGIPFANDGSGYVVTLADLDSAFTVTVSTSKTGFADAAATTPVAVTPRFADASAPIVLPTVAASTKSLPKGSTKYTVKPGEWTASAAAFSYSWIRAGVTVGTGPTYIEKASKTVLASTLEVVVTASAPGFGDSTALAVARRATATIAFTGAPVVTLESDHATLSISSPVVLDDTAVASVEPWIATDPSERVTFGYQWLRKVGKAKAVTISGATASTFTPKSSDIGAQLSVKITARSSRSSDRSITVAAGTVVGRGDLLAAISTLTLASPALADDLITAPDAQAWRNAGAQVTYQWYGCALPKCTAATPLDKFTKISGATDQYWSVPKAYANGRLFVSVTATKSGSRTVRVDTAPVDVIGTGIILVSSPPVIETRSGVRVEQWLSASYSGFSTWVETTREWQVCTSACLSAAALWSPAVGRTDWADRFAPAASNWGTGESFVRVADTAVRAGYTLTIAYSEPVALGAGRIFGSGLGYSQPYVSGNSTTGKWSRTGASSLPSWITTSVRWFVESTERSTATTFTAETGDAGKLTYAVETYSAQGFEDLEVVTRLRNGAPVVLTAQPFSIVGDSFGQTLTVDNNSPWDLPESEFANWEVTSRWTSGSTQYPVSATFTPSKYAIGQTLSVQITATSPLYGTFYATAILPGGVKKASAPQISGDASLEWAGELLPGAVLRPTAYVVDASADTTTLQWQRSSDGSNWSNIPGATAKKYTVALEDSKLALRLVITAEKEDHFSAVYETQAVTVLEGDVIRLLGVPVLSGDARVGSALTTTTGAWSRGVKPTIQWLLNGRAIPGATEATYVPFAIHAGDEISVRVTGKQAGKLDVSVDTSAYVIQKAAAPVVTKAPVVTGTTKLTATTGTWNTSGLTFTFEWSRAGEIVGTGSSIDVAADATPADYVLTVQTSRFGYEPGSWTQP